MTKEDLDLAVSELNRTFSLSPYEGFDVAWIAVVKMANFLPGRSEHDRLVELLEILPAESIRKVLNDENVEKILNLQPPLETVLRSNHERLNEDRTKSELEDVRQYKDSDPKRALRSLVDVLKRVRNRRAHGFKTAEGPRDNEILQPSLQIVRLIGYVAAEAMGAK
ncbi:MAG: hypothetical protein WKF71_03995 [Pyrinomonadaceae bacterium]